MTDEVIDQPKPGDNPTTPETAPGNNGGQSGANDNPTWLPERLARARASAVSELLKELGFEKPDDLKTLVTKAKQDEAAKLSEVEKAQKALDQEKLDRAKVEQDLADLKALRLTEKRHGALTEAAGKAKAEKPEHVLMWAKEYAPADLLTLVSEDGKTDEKAVEALIKKVQAAEPKWFGQGGPGSPSNRGGRTPSVKPKEIGRTFKL